MWHNLNFLFSTAHMSSTANGAATTTTSAHGTSTAPTATVNTVVSVITSSQQATAT
jgi:hypothetical protein